MSEQKNTSELAENMGGASNTPLCVSIPEAAKLIGVSRNTGYLMVRMKQLPVIECGKRRKVVPIAGLQKLLGNSPITENHNHTSLLTEG